VLRGKRKSALRLHRSQDTPELYRTQGDSLLALLNAKPFKKMPGSRQSWFEEIEWPALRPLPLARYEFATFSKAKVHIDYHIQVDYHYYSVPYQLVGETVELRLTVSTVEILHRGRRLTSHLRSFRRGGHTTKSEHMPEAHRRNSKWPPHRLINWAGQTGPNTAAMFQGAPDPRPSAATGSIVRKRKVLGTTEHSQAA